MLRQRLIVLTAFAPLLLVPSASGAQMAPSTMAAALRQAVLYLAVAGEADVYEITSSQIAVMKSVNPDIRNFATMLIDHHTRTTNLALAAAKAAGVTPPPPVLSAEKRAFIAQLHNATPADFDRLYLAQQVQAHEQALALHQGYSRDGDTESLRTTATGAIPIVQSHLDSARRLAVR